MMLSFFKRKQQNSHISSLIADSIRHKYEQVEYLERFHATESHDWFDFSRNKHDYTEFSRGLFWLCALEKFEGIIKENKSLSIFNHSNGEFIFMECVFFPCCVIEILNDKGHLNDLYNRPGDFYKLDGYELVLDELLEICCDVGELSKIHPQKIIDMWEDRNQFYNQLNNDNVSDYFKALCHLFALALRTHGDMPVNNILDIDIHDSSLILHPEPTAGLFLQMVAEQSLFNLIDIAKRTMHGYRDEDYK